MFQLNILCCFEFAVRQGYAFGNGETAEVKSPFNTTVVYSTPQESPIEYREFASQGPQSQFEAGQSVYGNAEGYTNVSGR